jgi:carbon monoxide dehydrogenase subunit G
MAEPLQFGGQERFDQTAETVFAAITNLDLIARILPDVESAERLDERTLRCVVRPGFSFLRGKLTATIARRDDLPGAEAGPPFLAAYRVDSKGIGVQVGVETTLRVEAAPSQGAMLRWQAEVVQLSGLVAAVSKPLIRGAAEQVIQKVWQRLRAELA